MLARSFIILGNYNRNEIFIMTAASCIRNVFVCYTLKQDILALQYLI